MSLFPSNGIAASNNPGRTMFPNLAGAPDLEADWVCASELSAAGITAQRFEFLRKSAGEVHTAVLGELPHWGFRRAWYYWVAEGPGIPPAYADTLHVAHGTAVRVNGHCGSPSPREQFRGFAVGLYHVDTLEGLCALADTIRRVLSDNELFTDRRVAR